VRPCPKEERKREGRQEGRKKEGRTGGREERKLKLKFISSDPVV
jgi:hypothetical protein